MNKHSILGIASMLFMPNNLEKTGINTLAERLAKLLDTMPNEEQEIALDILLSGTCQNEILKKGQVYWSDYGHLYIVVENGCGFKRAVLKRYRIEKETIGPEGVIMSSKNRGDFRKWEGISVVYYEGEDMWKAPFYEKVEEIQFEKEPSYEQLKALFKGIMPDVTI